MIHLAKRVYADHAATTPMLPSVVSAMQQFYQADFFNPSPMYAGARTVRKAVEAARASIASCIGADSSEVFFTSGGTESDNWAIKGGASPNANQHQRVITSQIEHPAVLNSCAFLARLGFDVVYLPTDQNARIDIDDLAHAITPDTALVSIMTANNEVGTIEPIEALSSVARERSVLFHTDAVQAVGHIPVNVRELGVDMLSASAHKFGGPKGVGFLFVRNGVQLEPLLSGGGQEHHQRAGTENVAGIVGMATALVEKVKGMERETLHLTRLREVFRQTLNASGLSYRINGGDCTLPGIISVSVKNADSEMLLHRLDIMGIQVANGSACDAGRAQLSHVLTAMRLPEDYAYGTVRVSFGAENTVQDAELVAKAISDISDAAGVS